MNHIPKINSETSRHGPAVEERAMIKLFKTVPYDVFLRGDDNPEPVEFVQSSLRAAFKAIEENVLADNNFLGDGEYKTDYSTALLTIVKRLLNCESVFGPNGGRNHGREEFYDNLLPLLRFMDENGVELTLKNEVERIVTEHVSENGNAHYIIDAHKDNMERLFVSLVKYDYMTLLEATIRASSGKPAEMFLLELVTVGDGDDLDREMDETAKHRQNVIVKIASCIGGRPHVYGAYPYAWPQLNGNAPSEKNGYACPQSIGIPYRPGYERNGYDYRQPPGLYGQNGPMSPK